MGVSGWPAQGAGKYSVRRSGKLYKKRLKELRTFSRSCAATALAEFSSGLRPKQNAARWRKLGNSAETRISIKSTPILNNNTNVVIGPSFRLGSPTIPKGRQAASLVKHLAQCSRSAAAGTSASLTSLSRSLRTPGERLREASPEFATTGLNLVLLYSFLPRRAVDGTKSMSHSNVQTHARGL